MLTRSIHFTLSCDNCGRSYGEISDVDNIATVLRPTKWGIVGNKHFCEHCLEEGLRLEKERNSKAKIEDVSKDYGVMTENGWIKISERMPEQGVSWVIGRTPSGNCGFCRYSKELGKWVDDNSRIIEEGIDYWHYVPMFP